MVLDNMNCRFIKCNLFSRSTIGCSVLVLGFLFTSAVQADRILEDLSDNERLKRLERMVSSDFLRKQTQTIRSLREEISALREQVEQQNFDLSSMKQRQRNLYLDIDRRINHVEAGGSIPGAPSVSPPNSTGNTTGDSSLNPSGDSSVAGGSGSAGDGNEEYTKAFTLLKEGQYKQSITAFKAFREAYPNSKYASNAQYWLGEANYVLRNYKKALTIFQQLIAQYPDSSKNPGAHLKIAYVHYELKKWSAARDALHKVIGLYPEASVAKKAKERLARMKKERH
jgi:tol-pal system protein YbgF